MTDRYEIVAGRIFNRSCEINAVEHCNLRCRACTHFSPALPKYVVDPVTLARHLDALSMSYHVKVMRLLGGEPLLHPDLLAVIDAVRQSGIADSVQIVTNGLLLPRMAAQAWRAIDSVQVSLYPGRSLDEAQQRECTTKAREHGVAIAFRAYERFQESYSEPGTTDEALVRRISATCKVAHRWRCHTVADGWFYRCPQSYLIPKGLAEESVPSHRDGLRIEASGGFRAKLLAYLQSPEPPQACHNCLGTAGRYIAHEQVRRSEFRARQQQTTEELLHPRLVGRGRATLAHVEGAIPRWLVRPLEEALRSDTLIGSVRKAQRATTAALRALDR